MSVTKGGPHAKRRVEGRAARCQTGWLRPTLSGRLCRRVSLDRLCRAFGSRLREIGGTPWSMDGRASYRRGSTQRGHHSGVCPAPLPMPHGGPAPSAAVPALRGAGPEVCRVSRSLGSHTPLGWATAEGSAATVVGVPHVDDLPSGRHGADSRAL